MWCCAPAIHKSSPLQNARSRTCWSECGEHNRIARETPRSSARGGRRLAQSPPSWHRCLLIKTTRARIAARSPRSKLNPQTLSLRETVVLRDWPAAGSSRHRQKTRQFLPAQASCRDPGTRLSHRLSSNANSLCSRNSAGSPEICATFQREILQQHF